MDNLKLTSEQNGLSQKNRKKAVKYFEKIGLLPLDRKPYEYVLHHKDENLRHTDIDRYIQWNPEDLVVMTAFEHLSLHHTGIPMPDEARKKISEFNKGNKYCVGIIRTDEFKKHVSEGRKGKGTGDRNAMANPEARAKQKQNVQGINKGSKWCNNGEINKKYYECDGLPEGFVPGMLKNK